VVAVVQQPFLRPTSPVPARVLAVPLVRRRRRVHGRAVSTHARPKHIARLALPATARAHGTIGLAPLLETVTGPERTTARATSHNRHRSSRLHDLQHDQPLLPDGYFSRRGVGKWSGGLPAPPYPMAVGCSMFLGLTIELGRLFAVRRQPPSSTTIEDGDSFQLGDSFWLNHRRKRLAVCKGVHAKFQTQPPVRLSLCELMDPSSRNGVRPRL
jgi:hypothetical protein